MPPTPAERLSIHKVKNGWTLDVDYAATRQFGDTYASPGYVYTTATRLVSDVMGFVLNGKAAESDFVGRHLSIHTVELPLASTVLDTAKQEAYVEGVRAGREEGRSMLEGWRKSSDKLNGIVQNLREANERLNDNCNEALKERDRLTEKLDAATTEGRTAWSKGRQSGIDFIMGLVKKQSAEYTEKWAGFFGGAK